MSSLLFGLSLNALGASDSPGSASSAHGVDSGSSALGQTTIKMGAGLRMYQT
jgi:hypothetical protein